MIKLTNTNLVTFGFAVFCLSAPLHALEQLADQPGTEQQSTEQQSKGQQDPGQQGAGQQNSDRTGAEQPAADASMVPDVFIARVEKVLSGDLVSMLLPSGTLLEVRLAGLEAPDAGSYYYQQSRDWLRSQLEGQLVSAECNHETAGRPECVLFPDERQINIVSLYHGFSVSNGKGSVLHDASYYAKYEDFAKANESGLWDSAENQMSAKDD